MKVIDLLNKIANGEEVPEYVKYYNMLEKKVDIMMVCKENLFYKLDNLQVHLNSRVEIIEEPQEHKIPEKLDLENDGNTITIYDTKHTEWTILDNVDILVCNKINEIIDYLEEIK